MSKMDNLRAMREARYEQAAARAREAAGAKKVAKPPVAPPPERKVVKAKATRSTTPAADQSAVDLCGHGNMSGRTCTREKGHAAKSHRYS